RDIGLDLIVEESGSLRLLGKTVGRMDPHVLHVSCHGRNDPPSLFLEDDEGETHRAGPDDLNRELDQDLPRLLFLSACLTSAPDHLVASFAGSLIAKGLPAVLGWGGSIHDREATAFAAALYGLIARRTPLETSVALSRQTLIRGGKDAPPSKDWHLARLHLGALGGGVLCGDAAPRTEGRVRKSFLDQRGQRVPVAGPSEFVGRRRQV
ncbi:MAG: CHAT domain-containing protein, partial [bacterium]|nr:CHAT domain-containing protein [bacterium]